MKAYLTPFVLVLILMLGTGIIACQNTEPQQKSSQGSLMVRTARVQIFDSENDKKVANHEEKLCGHKIAFLLKDGTYILPTNLNSFLKEPAHNQVLQITYRSEDSKILDCTEAKSVYLSHVDIASISSLK